ncbi:hypothetical protein VTI28DRAFT_7204 [Corynascus sepedonium]
MESLANRLTAAQIHDHNQVAQRAWQIDATYNQCLRKWTIRARRVLPILWCRLCGVAAIHRTGSQECEIRNHLITEKRIACSLTRRLDPNSQQSRKLHD